LLADRAPHRSQRGLPTDIEVVGVVTDPVRVQMLTGLFARLFLTRDSGSGLVTVCGGRDNTMPPAFNMRRTVSSQPRSPVASALPSAQRCQGHSEKGWPPARGRRRTSASNRARYAGVVVGSPPGGGAAASPAPPSAWYRRSQRRTGGSSLRTREALGCGTQCCSADSKIICARVRTRIDLVGR
jgi:hypothetical protein